MTRITFSRPAVAFCAFVVVFSACGERDDDHGRAPPALAASANADGRCEHGVVEVLCPKHHPSLAAVFQAKGDWCPEHGFPESICPVCHPERGGKPAVAVGGDDTDGPADGTKVKLKDPSLAQKAGIATVAAVVRDRDAGVVAVARVVYDAAKVAEVNARAAGVVRALRVDVGAKVKKGDALAVVDSADVGADRGGLLAARAQLQLAQSAERRERELLAKGIAAQKDVDVATAEREAAEAAVGAAVAGLGSVGAGDGGDVVVVSPLAGTVVERRVAVGQSVAAAAPLFLVVDASSMWAELDVPERALSVVREGQSVSLQIDALPDRRFNGTIQYLAPAIDPSTRTARARVALGNEDRALRAHMYGTARVVVDGARPSVWVPRAALQRARGVQLLFVQTAPGEYEARRVVVGAEDGEFVEVKAGIDAGAAVVTTGSFFLKTETLKDALGAGCCD